MTEIMEVEAEPQDHLNKVCESPESMEVVPVGTPHPLLIDHVIEKIVTYLCGENDDETALRSRLVCSVWDEIGSKALRFHSNRTVYFGKYFRSVEALKQFIHYVKNISSISHFPCGKFYLCEDIFKQNQILTVKSFFTECAPILTSLTIRLDNQSDLKVSEMDFTNMNLPYLKCLVLDDRRLVNNASTTPIDNNNNNDDDDINAPVLVSCLLEGIVKCSPGLRQLTVIHPPSSMFDDEETVSTRSNVSERNVAKMLVTNCPRHLKQLNLDIKLNDKVLLTLSQLPVNLTDLQLSLRESVFSKESLNRLLAANQDSLKSLRFSSMGVKSNFEVIFPTLPRLSLLELHSWDSQIQGVTFSKITYENNFPSLESLLLHTWQESPSWIQFFPAAYYGAVPSLTSLKLPQNFMYPAMIQNLSWLYPNLKKMDLHFSSETAIIVQRVFTHFGENLEELKIRDSLPREKFDICLDTLFTGLPRPICEKILRKRCFNSDEGINYFMKLRQKPSLLNLKNLKKLDIEDMLRHETYITDVTGYLVLLQMPNLRYLNMGRSQIDDECLRQLANKYPDNMRKELEVPKSSHRKMMMMTNSASNLILARAPSSVMTAYNYYCSSMDLGNGCVIV